ncbi:MAG: RNase adapter RapZ [Alphaproteobacteria bacterium]|nr:RNase adapter RapZ [Alphaproteobacteria bacterium]
MTAAKTRIVLITGMSGAGRSSGLRILEDLGYEAIDNLPVALLGRLLAADALAPERDAKPFAIDLDIRSRGFHAATFAAEIAPLRRRDDLEVSLVFFDCDDHILRRRFTETRRRHPLAADRPLMDGIRHERELMSGLRDAADLTVDTSNLSLTALRDFMTGHFRRDRGPTLALAVTSFAYRRGLPREADLVFDVRFLANPHYVDGLRPLSGLDAGVKDYVAADPVFAAFYARLADLLELLLPNYIREGKTYLTIAVGCTGGRHRSVFVAERVAADLGAAGYAVLVRHRDLDASGANRRATDDADP